MRRDGARHTAQMRAVTDGKVIQKGSGGAFVKVRKRDKVTLHKWDGSSVFGERYQPCSTQTYDQLLNEKQMAESYE